MERISLGRRVAWQSIVINAARRLADCTARREPFGMQTRDLLLEDAAFRALGLSAQLADRCLEAAVPDQFGAGPLSGALSAARSPLARSMRFDAAVSKRGRLDYRGADEKQHVRESSA